MAQISSPPPSSAFVLLDESPNTIDDGQFGLSPAGQNLTVNTWLNYPTARHNRASGFSFADGHAEAFRWVGGLLPQLESEVNPPAPPITVSGSDLTDLRRVQSALATPH